MARDGLGGVVAGVETDWKIPERTQGMPGDGLPLTASRAWVAEGVLGTIATKAWLS